MTRSLFLLLLIPLFLLSCGGDSGDRDPVPLAFNTGGNGQGGNHAQNGGGQDEVRLGGNEFIYRSGGNTIRVFALLGVNEDGSLNHSIRDLYVHPTEIETLMIIPDGSGVVFTADQPDSDYTHAAYRLSADGRQLTTLIEPFELDFETGGLLVEAIDPAPGQRMWFTIHQFSFGLQTSTNIRTPMSLDTNGMRIHAHSCNAMTRAAPNFQTGEVAFVEGFCNNSPDQHNVVVFDNHQLNQRTTLAESDRNTQEFFRPGTTTWLDEHRLLVGTAANRILMVDTRSPGSYQVYADQNEFQRFALSPDRNFIVGERNGDLRIGLVPDAGHWWQITTDGNNAYPSWSW